MNKSMRERFKDYRDIDGKIEDLKSDIKKLYSKWACVEVVQASDEDSPWTLHPVRVEGYGGSVYDREKIEELQSQINRWREEKAFIEWTVDSIPELKIQRVIRLRYIEGKTTRETAADIGDSMSEENVRKIIQRFFKTVTNVTNVTKRHVKIHNR